VCLNSHSAQPSSVELAVVEAVNNSIEHAYRSQSGNSVDVSFEYDSDCLNIRIKDYGMPMPNSIAGQLSKDAVMPGINVDMDSLPESGWGMQLLKSVCDEVSYKRMQSCNTLSLSFKLGAVTA